MYRPPRQNNERNNEEQVNIDEVLDKLKSSFPKIPGFGKGSPILIFMDFIRSQQVLSKPHC